MRSSTNTWLPARTRATSPGPLAKDTVEFSGRVIDFDNLELTVGDRKLQLTLPTWRVHHLPLVGRLGERVGLAVAEDRAHVDGAGDVRGGEHRRQIGNDRTAAEKLSKVNGGPVQYGFGAAIYGWLLEHER